MYRCKPATLVVILAVALLACGCASKLGEKKGVPTIIASSEPFQYFFGKHNATERMLENPPRSIAVLPFRDKLDRTVSFLIADADPAEVVRVGLYNHLSSLPFQDLEIHEVDLRLKNAGLTDPAAIDEMVKKDPEKLRSILGVDAVLIGDVTHFDQIFLGMYSQVAVGCDVKMMDLRDGGGLLWRAENVARAHAGGISWDPIGIAMATVAALWNLQDVELYRQTDELFREMVSTIPVPESALAMRAKAPTINLFTVLNPKPYYLAGEKIAFRLIGDPGCRAYVDMGDYKSGIELHPVSAGVKQALEKKVLETMKANFKETGHEMTPELVEAVGKAVAEREIYEGHYTVEPNEERFDLMAKGFLVAKSGAQSTDLDVLHPINIDSTPPKQVQGLSVKNLDGKVRLSWFDHPDSRLAGFEVQTSATPLSGFKPKATTEENVAVLSDLPNFEPVYFKVRAVDKAGNKGPLSDSIRAVPVPIHNLAMLPTPGSALAGGSLTRKVLLKAAHSPFTLSGNMVVEKSGGVYIEPGVTVLFAPGSGILAKGDFMAFGTRDKPVTFAPQSAKAGPGSYSGIVLNGAKRAEMVNVAVKGARTGVTVANCAPRLHKVTIENSAQAGLVFGENAKPTLTCATLKNNQGQGALVIQGAGVDPKIKDNSFLDNDIQIQNYSPTQLDLSGNYWGRQPPDPAFIGDALVSPLLSKPPHCDK